MIKKTIILLLLLYSSATLAWNATGHYLITTIAHAQLTPKAKANIDSLLARDEPKYHPFARIMRASEWADWIKNHGNTSYNTWHYISLPYSSDGTAIHASAKENVGWAIKQSETTLNSASSSLKEKVLALKLLLHFAGDIHQPFHCITHFSKAHPHGDNGGNAVSIHEEYTDNLHAYWDGGANLFRQIKRASRYKNIKKTAAKIMQEYPPSYFGNKINDSNPMNWAKESYTIAVNFGYLIPADAKPTTYYQTQAQAIIERQLALAGYRLGRALNTIFN